MTGTLERDVIIEAVSIIDERLVQIGRRELVSSGEVSDLLLDLRTALVAAERTEAASAPAETLEALD